MARPKKIIDANLVEGLAQIGCTEIEIARLAGCSVDTLSRRFAEVMDKGRQAMKMKLRRAQLRAAENGNATMLVWLGKQYLGQRDEIKHEVSFNGIEAARAAFLNLLEDYKDVPREVVAERVAKKFNVRADDLITDTIQ